MDTNLNEEGSQSTGVQTYQILIGLADEYLNSARSLVLMVGNDSVFRIYQKLISTAVRCLEEVLKEPILDPLVKIGVCSRLGEVLYREVHDDSKTESMLNTAIAMANEFDQDTLKLYLQYLYAQTIAPEKYSIKQSLLDNLIRDAGVINAPEVIFSHSIYNVLLNFNHNEAKGFEEIVKLESAPKSPDNPFNIPYVKSFVLNLHGFKLLQAGDFVKAGPCFALSEIMDQQRPKFQFVQLTVMRLMGQLLTAIYAADYKKMTDRKSQLYDLVNQLTDINIFQGCEPQWTSDGTFEMYFPIAHNGKLEFRGPVVFEWLSFEEIQVYVLLFVAIVQLVSEQNLDEGWIAIKTAYEQVQTIEAYHFQNRAEPKLLSREINYTNRLLGLKSLISCYKAIYQLNRNEWSTRILFETLPESAAFASKYLEVIDPYKYFIAGMQLQGTNMLEGAVECYKSALFKLSQEPFKEKFSEFRILVSLSLLLLISDTPGSRCSDPETAMTIRENLSPICSQHANPNIRMLWQTIDLVFDQYSSALDKRNKLHEIEASDRLGRLCSDISINLILEISGDTDLQKYMDNYHKVDDSVWKYFLGKTIAQRLHIDSGLEASEMKTDFNLPAKERLLRRFNAEETS